MARVLGHAKERGYTLYTSTLVEAWRLSISGLSGSILMAIDQYAEIPELSPDEDLTHDPIAQFGIIEAQRHRERGVSLLMFLGLMKYYRQSYLDLLHGQGWTSPETERYALYINRIFDRIEIAFCTEWASGGSDRAMQELQGKNRLMTNEKNKYLTIFESIPIPVIILNAANEIDNMNLAAAKFFHGQAVAGGRYYSTLKEKHLDHGPGAKELEVDLGHGRFSDADLFNFMPWISEEVARSQGEGMKTCYIEKEVDISGDKKFLGVRITKNLDVSEKFGGIIIIFEDLTLLKNEQKVFIEHEKLRASLETVGMVYHELAQPLQVIMGMSELMLLDPEASAEHKIQLAKITAAARALSNVIRKLDKITVYKTKVYVGQSSIVDLDESAKAKD